jgi:hypothetical protein
MTQVDLVNACVGVRHDASFDFEPLSAALQHATEVAKM